jgi:hypothetical protein
MRAMVAEMADWIKDLAFFKRIRNYISYCPLTILSDAGDESRVKDTVKRIAAYWDANPVHMSNARYVILANNLVQRIAADYETGNSGPPIAAGGSSSGAGTGTGSGTGIKRKRVDSRAHWIVDDETIAPRNDGKHSRGAHMGAWFGGRRGGRRGQRGQRGQHGQPRGSNRGYWSKFY